MPPHPFRNTNFQLDSSGVAGFFGGHETLSAMTTVHLYEGRKWLGWYNSPGSYEVAKRYGQLADSRFWDGIFPGVTVDPATMFELEGKAGPEYRGVYSGTLIKNTGHTGYLFSKRCHDKVAVSRRKGARTTTPMKVVIADLDQVRATDDTSSLALFRARSWLVASIPISVSIGCCACSAVFGDWWCFSMILLGIVASGCSCYVLGSGKLKFHRPVPATGSPPGDGFMQEAGSFIVLKGTEEAVGAVTRGKFGLQYDDEPEYRKIGYASILLTVQFLLQLLLIPQGTLFGQVMFLSSLAVSWIYTCYIASLDHEKVQTRVLMEKILKKPELQSYELGTRTQAAVLVLLALSENSASRVDGSLDIRKTLDYLLSNDTEEWREWKESIVRAIEAGDDLSRMPIVRREGLRNDLYSGDAAEAYMVLKRPQRLEELRSLSRGGVHHDRQVSNLSDKQP